MVTPVYPEDSVRNRFFVERNEQRVMVERGNGDIYSYVLNSGKIVFYGKQWSVYIFRFGQKKELNR